MQHCLLCCLQVAGICEEKESRMKETMFMMGVHVHIVTSTFRQDCDL